MSESSQSFHLRTHAIEDATRLLQAASAAGFVLEPKGEWVTFLCGPRAEDIDRARKHSRLNASAPPELVEHAAIEDAAKAATERVTRATTKPLLLYSFDEDFACVVKLFARGALVGELSASWGTGTWHFDDEAFRRAGIVSDEGCAALVGWLESLPTFPARQQELLEEMNALEHDPDAQQATRERYLADRYFVARALGLTEYTWLKYEAVADDKTGVVAEIV
jgi:hypothetical protein